MTPMQGEGYCECGCGERTGFATKTQARDGIVKGQPFRYVAGHNFRRKGPWFVEDPASGCWLWQGARDGCGYGSKWVDGHCVGAHRWSYEQHRGPIPAGLELDHLCRVRHCVNPDHLEPVSHLTNIHRSPIRKITTEQVAQIRAMPSAKAAAEAFGIGLSTAYGIRDYGARARG